MNDLLDKGYCSNVLRVNQALNSKFAISPEGKLELR